MYYTYLCSSQLYGTNSISNMCYHDFVLMKGLKGERGEEGPIGLPVSVT